MSNIDFQNGFIIGASSRMGGAENGSQSDWNQNDDSQADYIKNRTHWKEEIQRDYVELPIVEPYNDNGFMYYEKSIGLELDKEYTIDIYLTDGSLGETISIIAEKWSDTLPGPVIRKNNDYIILDNIFVNKFGQEINGNGCIYFINPAVYSKIVIHGVPNTETIIHKIPNEYLELDQKFNFNSKNAQSGVAIEELVGKKEIYSYNLADFEGKTVPVGTNSTPTSIISSFVEKITPTEDEVLPSISMNIHIRPVHWRSAFTDIKKYLTFPDILYLNGNAISSSVDVQEHFTDIATSYSNSTYKNWLKQELTNMVDEENIVSASLIVKYESVSQSFSTDGFSSYYCTPILKIQASLACANEAVRDVVYNDMQSLTNSLTAIHLKYEEFPLDNNIKTEYLG